jgi:hypothetical protein
MAELRDKDRAQQKPIAWGELQRDRRRTSTLSLL